MSFLRVSRRRADPSSETPRGVVEPLANHRRRINNATASSKLCIRLSLIIHGTGSEGVRKLNRLENEQLVYVISSGGRPKI